MNRVCESILYHGINSQCYKFVIFKEANSFGIIKCTVAKHVHMFTKELSL
jgi:hypothetical protein